MVSAVTSKHQNPIAESMAAVATTVVRPASEW